jgi:hypothetical protein
MATKARIATSEISGLMTASPSGDPSPAVCLIFPPLVQSSFGQYYASLPTLAAFLSASGLGTQQIDLNEEFALCLLDREHLETLASYRTMTGERLSDDSCEPIAAAWLRDHRSSLFDSAGRHAFNANTPPTRLLAAVAQPYLVDPPRKELQGPGVLRTSIAAVYRRLFEGTRIVERIAQSAALIGISVPMGPQLLPTLVLADLLKSAHPDKRIVVGGPTLSLMPDDEVETFLAHHPYLDAAIKFDGELPLLELAHQARDGRWEPQRVAGVTAKNGQTVSTCPPRPGLHPNQLPHLLYDEQILGRLADPELSVLQARGCYWGKCAYCDYVQLYDGSPPYRGRSPVSLVEEIRAQLARYSVHRFTFITESIPPAFARKACEFLLDQSIDISWTSFIMVDRRFDLDLLRLMRSAGCDYLIVGMETMNDRVLKLVDKSATREENIRFIKDSHEAGIDLRVNLIPDLPSTTVAEADDALAEIAQLQELLSSVTVFPFEATRSSRVGQHPELYGLAQHSAATTSGQAQYSANHLEYVDPAMSSAERDRIHKAYESFAVHVNSRGQGDESYQPPTDPLVSGKLMRVNTEYLVCRESDASLCWTNIVTWEQITIGQPMAGVAADLMSGDPFTPEDVTRRLGQHGAELLSLLRSEGLLDSYE